MTSLSKADAESALAEIIADRSLTRPHELASNMSKREFFAAQAIAGLMKEPGTEFFGSSFPARRAVDIADALIEALNETDTSDQCRTADAE